MSFLVAQTDTKVTVNDLNGEKPPRMYSFDHAFWSHDGFIAEPNGYMKPAPGSPYTDQKKVWNLLGAAVLEKAWKGLNNTIFAYGQTGAGKSYSIFGYPGNPGIIPMAATALGKGLRPGPSPSPQQLGKHTTTFEEPTPLNATPTKPASA